MKAELESLAWQLWRPDGTLLSRERAAQRLGELLLDSAAPAAAPGERQSRRGDEGVEEIDVQSAMTEGAESFLDAVAEELRRIFCDPVEKKMKPEYRRLIDHELTVPAIVFLAGQIISVLGAAVILPEVAVLAAFLLLKRGLDDRCKEA